MNNQFFQRKLCIGSAKCFPLIRVFDSDSVFTDTASGLVLHHFFQQHFQFFRICQKSGPFLFETTVPDGQPKLRLTLVNPNSSSCRIIIRNSSARFRSAAAPAGSVHYFPAARSRFIFLLIFFAAGINGVKYLYIENNVHKHCAQYIPVIPCPIRSKNKIT